MEYAQHQDARDPLARFRLEFDLPTDTIYLNGNSLGLCSKRAEQSMISVLQAWKKLAIDGWGYGDHPWFTLSEELGHKMAPIVGAKPHEVIITGSTTVNLHQMVATFYRPQGKRIRILMDESSFPTDRYVIESQLRLHGIDPSKGLSLVPTQDGKSIDEEEVIAAMTDEVALILLPTVLYRTGQLLNVQRLTEEAHCRGISIGWDACHCVGTIPRFFHQWGVDFAVWCTYKYLNSGPGGVAALYVHEKHHGQEPGLTGWFGSHKGMQFEMTTEFHCAADVGAFQLGTPHILSVSPLIGSLEIFQEATVERIREKSLRLTRYLMDLVQKHLTKWNFVITTPQEDAKRGGHVSLEHPEAVRICKALKEHRIITDCRPPNVIRLSPVALYVTYTDVWKTVACLRQIMESRLYEQYPEKRSVVV